MAPTTRHPRNTVYLHGDVKTQGTSWLQQLLGTPVLLQLLVLMIKLKPGRKLLKMCDFKQQVTGHCRKKDLALYGVFGVSSREKSELVGLLCSPCCQGNH